MQQKIHMKAAFQCPVRHSPLGNNGRLRILFIQKSADILPQADVCASVLISLHQAGSHIHTEAVAAHFQPEFHHVFHSLPGSHGFRGFRCKLPGLLRIDKTIVKGRLGGIEIDCTAAVPIGDAPDAPGNIGDPLKALPHGIRPDIPMGISILSRFHGFPEPRMLHRGMPRHQIQDQVHSPFVDLRKNRSQVLVGPVSGSSLVIVGYVVARIRKGGCKARIHPDGIASQFFDIIQAPQNPSEVSNPVPVAVLKALGINLIKYRIL